MLLITLCLGWAAPIAKSAEPDLILYTVKQTQPALSETSARRLSEALRDVTRTAECRMPWQILLSIAFNESSLLKGSVNTKSQDYGLMQINKKILLSLRLNAHKLVSDERYSLSAACQILTDNKQRFGKKYPYWIGLYRSGTALHKKSIRDNAIAYHRIIMKTAHKFGYRPDRTIASH